MRNQIIKAAVMILLGSVVYIASTYYMPAVKKEIRTMPISSEIPETQVEQIETEIPQPTDVEYPLEPEGFTPALNELNLAYSYPEGSDETDPQNSHAGVILKKLMETDIQWINQAYSHAGRTPEELAAQLGRDPSCIYGKYNPTAEDQDPQDPGTWKIQDFSDIRMQVTDGDGNPISLYSNIQEIMSMANIYTYYQDPQDPELFLSYCRKLWGNSHSCSISMTDVYYCDGCLNGEESKSLEELVSEEEETLESESSVSDENPEETKGAVSRVITAGQSWQETDAVESEEESFEETATDSDASPTESFSASPSDADREAAFPDNACPGHIDLIVNMKIRGLTENNGLFQADSIGSDPTNFSEDGWQGWNQYTMASARVLAGQDWFERYGLSQATISTYSSLSRSEVNYYMKELPEDLSDTRKAIVRFALESVGRVPYYWGGKPAHAGYSGNQFGVLTGADYKGRVLKGLDCSGWVSWVYWSVTGNRLPHESTSGLALCGSAVSKEDLRPGDILIRTGTDAHAIMFLSWTADGQIRCIHESSAAVNNVTISTRDSQWQYYRNILGD